MTLVAPAKPPGHHKKYTGQHHRRTKVYHKAYWPYLPILLIVFGGVVLNNGWLNSHAVLAYATDMSTQSLVDDTNAQRASNGLAGLSLNSQLEQAAQAKANDMVARNYWSHNTPDGQTPWSFITAAGYNYQTAGENLAYGFTSASDTVTAWMNSPEHRANILNTTYQEVGFGVANSANYQNSGPETVVVAEYAEPVTTVASPAPVTPAAPASTPAPTTHAAGAPVASTPEATPVTPTPASPSPATSTPTAAAASPVVTTTTQLKPITETKPSAVSRVQLLTAGKAPWSISILTILMASGMLIFFSRHGIAWHRVIRRGERFVLKHPTLDIVATLVIVVGLLLSRTVGMTR